MQASLGQLANGTADGPIRLMQAFSSVPSKSLANILIMDMPLLRLPDIVDEGEACPNNAVPARRTTAFTNSRCPSALRQSPQSIFQPIKQSRRQRQHRQHGCEYNRRCPSIICNPVRQLADRYCAGKDHVNDRKHFSAELSRRCPLNKRDNFNRRNARPHHDPCRTNHKHGEHACICAEQ